MINVRRLAVVGEMAMGASYQRYRLSSLTALHHHHVRAASVSTTTRPWRGTTLPGHSAFGGNDAVRLLSTKSTAAQPVKRKPGRPSKKALEERARLELERQQNEEMARIQQEQEQLALAEQERLKMEEEELRVQEEVRQMLLLEEEAARAVAEEEGISPAPDAIAPPEYDAATEQMIQETGLLPLTEEQAPILEAVKTGKNVFFTGPAGSGKSLILKHITHFLQEQGKQLSVTAPTGVAAILVGGETIHSWANMHSGDKPIYDYLDRSKTVLRRIDKKMMKELRGEKTTKPTKLEKKYLAMKHAEVLLIDEISMVSQDMFDRLDVILRCVKKKPGLLFG
ncbi:P-loop containing nucleoside triphosphate hydrolase protein [Peziza echinospora]|nr:P-loop containing nucleoside triphosphate hydrolase protein [Peziza echinospora]